MTDTSAIEIYQWLLRQNGFTVSDTGYWVYANASKDKAAFDWKLQFDLTVVASDGKMRGGMMGIRVVGSFVARIAKRARHCL